MPNLHDLISSAVHSGLRQLARAARQNGTALRSHATRCGFTPGHPHHSLGMGGRVKRKEALREAEERTLRAQAAAENLPRCAFCHRPLGARVEWHHPVPKSEGGTETVPVHPICHRTIHAHVSNHDLAGAFADLRTLRARPDLQPFLRWIANKPPDFHAPTRRSLDKGR